MRTWGELREMGRRLESAEIDAVVQSLAADERFAAVAAILDRSEESWVKAIGNPNLANSPNRAMHCAGGVHAVQRLQAGFMRILSPDSSTGGMEAPADE